MVNICWIKIIHNSVHFWDGKSTLLYIFTTIKNMYMILAFAKVYMILSEEKCFAANFKVSSSN